MKSNKQIDVKGALALAGAFHFLFAFGQACILPFLTLYFRHLGLDPVMTGIIMGSKHLVSLFWRPLSSFLAKVYNKRRALIAGSLMCSAGVALVVLLVPSAGYITLASNCSNSAGGMPSPGSTEGAASNNGSEGRVIPTVTPEVVHNHTTADLTATHENSNHSNHPNHRNHTTANLTATHENSSNSNHHNHTTPNLTATHKNSNHSNHPDHHNHTTANLTAPHENSSNNSNHPDHRNHTTANLTATHENSSSNSNHPDHHNHTTANLTATHKINAWSLPGKQGSPSESNGTAVRDEVLGWLKGMDAQHQLLFLLLLLVCVWEVASAPVEWTADDGLFEYLDYVDASDRYGGTGTWGVLGAACGVGGVGLLVSRLSCLAGAFSMPGVAVHLYGYATLTALALPAVVFLPLYLNKKRGRSKGLGKALTLVRADSRALLCAVTAFLVGAAVATTDNFLLWQMEDCKSTELHMGVTLSLALFSRAAFPLISGWMSKLVSSERVLTLGVFCLALQCLYYSVLWEPWSALPAQLLSCFSGGALWWAVQAQVEGVATPGAERSVKRVYQSLCLDLGLGLGSVSGGLVVKRFGVAWLFRGAAAGLALWCLCLLVLQWKAPRQRKINYSRLLATQESEASDSESEQEKDWLDTAFEKNNRVKLQTGKKINID